MGAANSKGFDQELDENLPVSMIPGSNAPSFSPTMLKMAMDVAQDKLKDSIKTAVMQNYPALFTVNPATAAGAALLVACLLVVDSMQSTGESPEEKLFKRLFACELQTDTAAVMQQYVNLLQAHAQDADPTTKWQKMQTCEVNMGLQVQKFIERLKEPTYQLSQYLLLEGFINAAVLHLGMLRDCAQASGQQWPQSSVQHLRNLYSSELTTCLDKFKTARVKDFRWRRLSDEQHGLFDSAGQGDSYLAEKLFGSGFTIRNQKPLATASYVPDVSQKVKKAVDDFCDKSLQDIHDAMNGLVSA